MKKLILLLATCLFIMGCEKVILSDENSQMKGFYKESCYLFNSSLDSVKLFSRKLNDYTTRFPESKKNSLYPKIQENIKTASLRVTVECDSAWAGTIDINFDINPSK